MVGNTIRQGWLKVGLTFAGLLVGAMAIGSAMAIDSELSLATILSQFSFDRHGVMMTFVMVWFTLLWFADRRMQRQVDLASSYAKQAASWVEHIEARAQEVRTDHHYKAMEQLTDGNPQLQIVGIYGLERLMQEDPEQYWRTGIETLCATVRSVSAIESESSSDVHRNEVPNAIKAKAFAPGPGAVCQAALLVLGRRDEALRKYDPPDLNLSGAELSASNLSQCNLSKVNLSEAKLSGSDLNGANLSQSNLRRSNLSWAKLRMVNLCEAKLSEANLSWSNLYSSDLSGAELDGADLCGVDLWRANLRRANLNNASLRKANLSGADLRGADLSEADFEGARGLRLAQLLVADSLNKIKLDANLKKQLDDHRCRPAAALISSIEHKSEREVSEPSDKGPVPERPVPNERTSDTLPTLRASPIEFIGPCKETVSSGEKQSKKGLVGERQFDGGKAIEPEVEAVSVQPENSHGDKIQFDDQDRAKVRDGIKPSPPAA